MAIPQQLTRGLRLPVIGAPMFIVSNPDLVIAQCTAGIIGAFPSLNPRAPERLDMWLEQITGALAVHDAAHPEQPAAPYAVNLIVHRSNPRLMDDLAICAHFKVPLVITSLGANEAVNAAVHEWGGLIFHDVINQRFARKTVEKGADGLILVAQAMGGDFAYIGSPFIATEEARASAAYKQGIVAGSAADIVYSSYFTGVHGNYLRASIIAQGLDPDALPQSDPSAMDFAGATGAKAWRDIWGAGQGIGAVDEILPAPQLIARLATEYAAARAELCDSGPGARTGTM